MVDSVFRGKVDDFLERGISRMGSVGNYDHENKLRLVKEVIGREVLRAVVV